MILRSDLQITIEDPIQTILRGVMSMIPRVKIIQTVLSYGHAILRNMKQ